MQRQAIPLALQKAEDARDANYVDLMVSSQTGSGKTAAFLLPVLHTLIEMDEQAKAAEKAEFDRKVLRRWSAAKKRPASPSAKIR